MDILELRQKALELINEADDEDLLAVIDLLQQPLVRKYQYTEDDIIEWNDMAGKYFSGETKGYTREEVKDAIKENTRKKNGI